MKLFTSLSIAILAVALFQGCIKDKGNYQYREINELSIKNSLPDTFTVLIQDTLRIDLEMEQSLPNKNGLSYDWVMYPGVGSEFRIHIGDASKVRFYITEEPKVYDLDLFVTDNDNNVSFYKKFYVKVTSIYNQGWLVMEEENGHNDIAIIKPDNVVEHNLYSRSNGGAYLPSGDGMVRVFSRRTEQVIYFLSENNGIQVSPGNFVRNSTLKDWFFLDPGPVKPLEIFTQGTEEHFLTREKAYGNNLNSPAPYKFGLATPGDYFLAPYQISTSGMFVFYDTLARRFWFRAPGNGDFPLSVLSSQNNNNAPWNMNNIGRRLLYANMSTGNTGWTALFESLQRDSMFIVRGQAAGSSSYIQTVDTLASGLPMQTAGRYLAARLVPHIYYAVGNQLYLYDIPAKAARLVYSFPAGTDVRSMKWYNNIKSSSDPDNYRLMMVATQEGAEGKVYLFPVDLTGDFSGGTYRNVFSGFGQIRDVTYKNTP